MKWSGLLVGTALVAAASMLGPACSHEWDSYDPPSPAGATSTGDNGGQGGDGSSTLGSGAEGASPSSSSAGGQAAAGGTAGNGGAGVGGCAPRNATGYRAQVLADCPVAYFRVGEPGGTTTTDEVGGLDATLAGGPMLGQPGALPNDTDTAVTLDGVNDSICLGDVFDFGGPASFTVEVWMSPSLIDNAYRRVYAKESGISTAQRTGYLFWVRKPDPTAPSKTAMSFEIWLNDTRVAETPLLTLPTVGAWTHVVTRADAATHKAALFLNGVLVQEDIDAGTTVDTTGAFCWGSTSAGTANFGGSLDELAIYDHALTDARIAAHYQAVDD